MLAPVLLVYSAVADPAPIPGVTSLGVSADPAHDAKLLAAALDAKGVRQVVLAAGHWTVSGPLAVDCALVGAGPERTVLRIVPGRPRKAAAETAPRAVHVAGSGRLEGLTVEVLGNDANAVGLVLSSGANVTDVHVRTLQAGADGMLLAGAAADDEGTPVLQHAYAQDVVVEGFSVGVRVAGGGTLLTADRLSVGHAGVCGLRFEQACGALHRYAYDGSGAAMQVGSNSVVAVDGAVLSRPAGAPRAGAAIDNAGFLRLCDIHATGWGWIVAGGPGGDRLAAWTSHPALGADGARTLDVQETPDSFQPAAGAWSNACAGIARETSVMSWGKPVPVADWAPALQGAVDAGATGIFLPPNTAHAFLSRVRLQGRVRVLDGLGGSLHQVVHGSGERYGGEFVIGDGEGPLEIRDLDATLGNLTIRHAGKRTLVLRRSGGFRYVAEPGAGDLFLVDARPASLVLAPGQHVWARGLTVANTRGPLVRNAGAELWILGFAASRWSTLVATSDNGRTEIVGGLAFAGSWRPKDPLLVIGRSSHLTATLGEQPASPLAYDVLLADEAGLPLVRREAAPRRGADGADRAAGSALTLLVAGTGEKP